MLFEIKNGVLKKHQEEPSVMVAAIPDGVTHIMIPEGVGVLKIINSISVRSWRMLSFRKG